MIADCETCARKQVPCKSCQESQRAICYRCDGDVDDPYCEIEEIQVTTVFACRINLLKELRDDQAIHERACNDVGTRDVGELDRPLGALESLPKHTLRGRPRLPRPS